MEVYNVFKSVTIAVRAKLKDDKVVATDAPLEQLPGWGVLQVQFVGKFCKWSKTACSAAISACDKINKTIHNEYNGY